MHTNTVTHTSSSHLQPREVMKTNGRVLFPLGPEEELSHQANFILVWPRDSISSGCFYKRRAAPRHRPVMDMRAWWPDGRCWPCNSSSKHSLMTPLAPRTFLTQCNVAAWVCICKLVLSKQTVLLFSKLKHMYRFTVIVWCYMTTHSSVEEYNQQWFVLWFRIFSALISLLMYIDITVFVY